MRLVTFEPAPGCQRLGVIVDNKIVDLALADEKYRSITASRIL